MKKHKEALSTYTDISKAAADGYRMAPPYVRTGDGVLGVPFINLDAPKLDPEQPTVLFYDLLDDGTASLLGVEWLVPAGSTDSPPSMFGTEFHEPMAGETPALPEHYGLHAWLFHENPAGMFARYNPDVTPPSFIDGLETAWNALAEYAGGGSPQDAGYTNTEKCISTSDGRYGVPFVDTDRVGTDPANPPILLYMLTSNWSYRLVGAEWYVPADSVDTPPSMFGTEFHPVLAGHSPKTDQPKHYGLHAWLFYANPAGLFADYNPLVKC